MTKDAIDSATKPIEANEANKSRASQDSHKESTCYDENSDNNATSNELICGGDLINYYHPILCLETPRD